jgi:hypothetical protein
MGRTVALGADGGPADVRAFLETYRDRLVANDLDAVTAAYRMPLPVVRPDRVRLVDDAATLREELRRILDFYRWSGMTAIELADLRQDGFQPGLALASFTWIPRRGDGAEIARIHQTYALRRGRDGLRIAAVMAHDEERARVPIVAEALAAIGGSISAPRPADEG